jgi:hypothetical protein
MALFYGGAAPLHRQLKGLLLPGLPRGQIRAQGRLAGLPLPVGAALPEFLTCGLQEAVPDPVGQGPPVLLCRPLKQFLLALGDAHV